GAGGTDRTVAPPAPTGPAFPDIGTAADAGATPPQPAAGTTSSPAGPTIRQAVRAKTPLQPTETVDAIRPTGPESSLGPSIEPADRAVAGPADMEGQRTATPAAEGQDAGEPPLWARAEAHPATASTLAAEVTAALDEHPTDEPRRPVVIEIGQIEVRIAADHPPPRRERSPRPRTGPPLAEYLEGRSSPGGRSA
ncbi:hypothetical protein V6U84_54405, partial [Micromonospora sp. CPCC 205714]